MNDYTNTILRWLSWSPSRYGSWFDSREGIPASASDAPILKGE